MLQVGVLYAMPKKYGVSIRLNKLVSNLKGFEIREIEPVVWRESKVWKAFFILRQIFRILRKDFNPDVLIYSGDIMTASIPALVFKKLKKKPIINDHDDAYYDLRKFKPKIWHKQYWEYLCALKSDASIGCSLEMTDMLKGISEKKIEYIPEGVDITHYDPSKYNSDSVRKELEIGDAAVILFLGHVGFYKGRLYGKEMIDAVHDLKEKYPIKFVWIGYGNALEKLKEYVKEKGMEKIFIFTGMVLQQDMPRYISAADFCIDAIPAEDTVTYNIYSRASMKIKEYMAMGKPVIAFDMRENKQDLDNGKCGLLIENHYKLKDAVEWMIFHVKEREEMGRNARIRAVEVYDIEIMAGKLEKIIGEVIAL